MTRNVVTKSEIWTPSIKTEKKIIIYKEERGWKKEKQAQICVQWKIKPIKKWRQ
jgi:hypothetical protein